MLKRKTLKPQIVREARRVYGVELRGNEKGWWNEELELDFIQNGPLARRPGHLRRRRALMVHDLVEMHDE